MWDLLCKEGIGEMLDAQLEKYFDTEAATQGLSKWLLTSISSLTPIATLFRLNASLAMEKRKYKVSYALKKLMDTLKPYKD